MSKKAPLVKGDGRDAKGRFVKGRYKGGPGGNPNQHRMLRLKKALLEAITAAQVARVIKKMGELGANGDVAAAKLYLEHAVGKPEHRYDPRQVIAPDGEKRRQQQYSPAEKRLLAKMLLSEADNEEHVIDTEGEEVSE